MGNKVSIINRSKFQSQHGQCYYCLQPMWIGSPTEYCLKYGMSLRKAASFQSTAEHLIAKCDGGKDVSSNIASACMYCNKTRHRAYDPLEPDAYIVKVRKRMTSGKWHGFSAVQ